MYLVHLPLLFLPHLLRHVAVVYCFSVTKVSQQFGNDVYYDLNNTTDKHIMYIIRIVIIIIIHSIKYYCPQDFYPKTPFQQFMSSLFPFSDYIICT